MEDRLESHPRVWPWYAIAIFTGIAGFAVASLVVFRGLDWHQTLTDKQSNGSYYLLSSESQVLAAILALVIAVSLAGAAVAVRYMWRVLDLLLGWWLLLYGGPYAIGIVYPLFVLPSNPQVWQVRFSLAIGVYCVALLIPYTMDLRRHLNIRLAIAQLRDQARRNITANARVREVVLTLAGLAYGAHEEYDIDSFNSAVESLRDVGRWLADDPESQGEIMNLLQTLGPLGRQAVTNPRGMSRKVPGTIPSIVFQAAPRQRWLAVRIAADVLLDIGQVAAEREDAPTAKVTLSMLKQVADAIRSNEATNPAWRSRHTASQETAYNIAVLAGVMMVHLNSLDYPANWEDTFSSIAGLTEPTMLMSMFGDPQSRYERKTQEFLRWFSDWWSARGLGNARS